MPCCSHRAAYVGGMFVERAQREVNRDFINNVAAQKLGQPRVIAAQFEAGLFECIGAGPIFVHKTKEIIATFRGGFNLARKLNGARVGAQNQHVTQVAPMPAKHREPTFCSESREAMTETELMIQNTEELRGYHANGEQR